MPPPHVTGFYFPFIAYCAGPEESIEQKTVREICKKEKVFAVTLDNSELR